MRDIQSRAQASEFGVPAGRQWIHRIGHNRVDRVEFSYEARHELFTARQRKFSIATQPNRYRVDHGGFGYLSQKGYWISPVFFDDVAVQTMRRRAWLRRLLLVKVTQLWPR